MGKGGGPGPRNWLVKIEPEEGGLWGASPDH